jgi:hypothetical protein
VSSLLMVGLFIYTLITFALMLYHNTHEHDEADRRAQWPLILSRQWRSGNL